MPNVLKYGGWAVVTEAKTADYTIKPRDNGKLFTNRGAAGTVIFTLPKINSTNGLKGVAFEFFTVAAQILRVTSDPADSLVVTADAAADTVSSTVLTTCRLAARLSSSSIAISLSRCR